MFVMKYARVFAYRMSKRWTKLQRVAATFWSGEVLLFEFEDFKDLSNEFMVGKFR